MKRTCCSCNNASLIPPRPQQFIMQRNTAQHDVGDWTIRACTAFEWGNPMPRSHITECGPKIAPWNIQGNELTYLRFLHTIAEQIGRRSRAKQGGKKKKKKKKERSVITTRCAASIRSVTALLFILNTELFPPEINLTGIWFRRWMKSSRRIAGTRSLMSWIYLKRHVIWKHTGGKLQGIWGRAWSEVLRSKGSSATATNPNRQ